jgi:hypothetical protein
MIDFTSQPPLPAPELRASDWSLVDNCNFASQIYNSIYHAITVALVREVGHDKTYDIHAQMLRHHQEHFFLSGLKKLGLDSETSDAVRCAKYHCLSNGLGGLRMGYAVENSRKVWLFYLPHTPDNAWAGQAALAHSRGNMLSDYRGWHANNGARLGNRGLRYVATQFVCDGDRYDGGYFEDTGRNLGPDELVIEKLGEQLPAGLEIRPWQSEINPQEWPVERRAKALRNYAVTWAADRVWSVLQSCGEQGEKVARRGIQAILFSWLGRFRAAVGGDPDRALEFARFVELFHSAGGIRTRVEAADGGWDLVVDKGLAQFVGGPLPSEEQAWVSRVFTASWDAVARPFGCFVTADDTGTRWTVRQVT